MAYVVGPLAPTDLRPSLAAILPDYMVPATFVQLEQLPLTPNGKLDSAKLPAPEATAAARQAGYVPPNDALENQLVDIWEAVLKVQPIGIHDNYFELGGHSLQTIALFAQIERAFNQTIPLAIIFQAPTIAELAAALRHRGESPVWSPLVPISASGSKRPFFCVHGGAGHVYHYRGLARHLGPDQPFYGLQPRVLQGTPSHYSSVRRMAHDYVNEIRKLQPEGPYAIGGFCFGGIVAFEMAQQLTRMGQEVALVAIIDAFSPTYSSSTDSFSPVPAAPRPESSRWQRHAAEIKKQAGLFNKLAYINKSMTGRFRTTTQSITSRLENLEYFWNRLLIHWYGVVKRPLPLWLRNFQLLEVNRHAKKEYIPEIYPGDLSIFRQVEETEEDIAPDMGWGQLTSKSVHVHTIPGGHLSLLQEPHVQQLAQLLQASLEASHSSSLALLRHPQPLMEHND